MTKKYPRFCDPTVDFAFHRIFGSEQYKDATIGVTGGDAAVFSLGPVRIPNTVEGGVILFKDSSAFTRALLIRDCGIDRTFFRDNRGEIDHAYDISLSGYSAMMSNVNGYIGCKQMEAVDMLLSRQREQAMCWAQTLAEDTSLVPITVPDGSPNYWVYGLLAVDKSAAINAFRAKGFYASGVHVDLSRYSVFGSSSELPGVSEFERHFLAVPCGWWM